MASISSAGALAYMTRGMFTDIYYQEPPVFVPGETLDNSPASIIAQYIMDVTALMTLPSLSGSWPLYVHHLPDDNDVPTNAGAVRDTAGVKDGRLMIGPTIQHYGMQVMIRAKTYEEGWAKANAIARSFDGVHNVIQTRGAEDYQIMSISQTSSVAYIGLESGQSRRKLFTVNIRASIKQVE